MSCSASAHSPQCLRRERWVSACCGTLTPQRRYFVKKKVLLLLSVIAMMVLLFAPAALATHHTAMSTATSTPTSSATATTMATATASATALPKSGGPELVGPITLAASLVLIASGLGALALVRRSVS